MRVMLDTNVIISDLIFGSPTIVEAERDIATHHEMLLCTYVIDEAREVVTPLDPEPGHFDIRDPKDYPVLYSAMLAEADVLVTGDKDFGDVDVDRPEILTPAEYVERYVER